MSDPTTVVAGRPERTGDRQVFADATFLIADDHQPNLDLLEQILSREGATHIHLTTDPAEVVALFRRLQPDIVLLDLHMPGMDGLAIIAALQQVTDIDEFVPVIVLTADSTTAARDRVLAAGASDFLTKPVDRAEVVLRTRNLLHTRRLHRNVQQRNALLRHEIAERTAVERRAAVEYENQRHRIEQVLQSGSIRMVFQPIVELGSGLTVGYEALARFDQDDRPPNEWFHDAEAVGLGVELEVAAVAAAVRELAQLPESAFLALNVSPAAATAPELAAVLAPQPPDRLVLEITEHAPVRDYDSLVATLAQIGPRLRIAVDDAGAGFASLQHILRLRPHIIKLDIALVRGIDRDPIKRALASSLVTFSREIGSTIIAEGIETEGEMTALISLGVAWGQGFHLGRPAELSNSDLRALA